MVRVFWPWPWEVLYPIWNALTPFNHYGQPQIQQQQNIRKILSRQSKELQHIRTTGARIDSPGNCQCQCQSQGEEDILVPIHGCEGDKSSATPWHTCSSSFIAKDTFLHNPKFCVIIHYIFPMNLDGWPLQCCWDCCHNPGQGEGLDNIHSMSMVGWNLLHGGYGPAGLPQFPSYIGNNVENKQTNPMNSLYWPL